MGGRRPICEYCGCRQIEPLAELMDEHLALLDLAADVRTALGRGDRTAALEQLCSLGVLLDRHVRREERGVFAALAEAGEYLEEIGDLEQEHVDFDTRIQRLDPGDPSLAEQLNVLFADLSDHIDREDLGIFPVSVVTLGASGWDIEARAHDEEPSFLAERPRRRAEGATSARSPRRSRGRRAPRRPSHG